MSIKIAVISDDLILNEKIIKALDISYNVKLFSIADNLIDNINEFNPDLVIIDIISVSSKFTDIIQSIKNDPSLSEKKVLIMSQNKRIDFISGPSAMVAGYLSKPVDFDELKRLIDNNQPETDHIVIIDDDEEFSSLMKAFLTSLDYKVTIINNPVSAFQIIKGNNIGMIFLDLIMPHKDGFEILAELSSDKKTSKIPVIVVTALEFNSLKQTQIISGYPQYISRDLSPSDIKDAIDKALSENLFFDVNKPKVLFADDQIELLVLIKETIEKAGFLVLTAVDGNEAIEKTYQFNPDVLILDYDMPVKNGLEVASVIKSNPLYSNMPVIIVTAKTDKQTKIKGLLMGIDDYITKPVDTDELIARLKMIVKRNKQVLDSNPLSKLPGNPSIQARVEKAIEKGEKFAVLYIDLNNFKAYNDVYGFEAGDNVIKTVANILVNIIMPTPNSTDFIGHIGGDDFIVITSIEKAEDIAKKIINNFNQIVPSFYNETDRKNGFIVTRDRQGNITQFPLMGIAIGIVHNLYKPLKSYAQVSHIGSELKKAAKSASISTYVIDRRRN
ncbi:MAG: response regulator [Elusimicrobiales bacterium]|nr:response regulator [Elusimicrobiales bacterium]